MLMHKLSPHLAESIEHFAASEVSTKREERIRISQSKRIWEMDFRRHFGCNEMFQIQCPDTFIIQILRRFTIQQWVPYNFSGSEEKLQGI